MTQTEIDQIIKVLSMLRQSTTTNDDDQSTDLQREARILLAGLLQSNGVDTAAL